MDEVPDDLRRALSAGEEVLWWTRARVAPPPWWDRRRDAKYIPIWLMAGSWLLLILNLPESSPLRNVTVIAGLPAVITLSIIHLRAVHRARQRMYHVVTDRFVRLLVPRWTFGPVPYSFRLEKLHGLRFVEDGKGGGTLWFGADTRVPGQRVAPWTGNGATLARLEDVADPRPAFEAIQRARSVGPCEG